MSGQPVFMSNPFASKDFGKAVEITPLDPDEIKYNYIEKAADGSYTVRAWFGEDGLSWAELLLSTHSVSTSHSGSIFAVLTRLEVIIQGHYPGCKWVCPDEQNEVTAPIEIDSQQSHHKSGVKPKSQKESSKPKAVNTPLLKTYDLGSYNRIDEWWIDKGEDEDDFNYDDYVHFEAQVLECIKCNSVVMITYLESTSSNTRDNDSVECPVCKDKSHSIKSAGTLSTQLLVNGKHRLYKFEWDE